MKVHKNIAKLPSFKNAVITIGTFDGVHKGHQKILNRITTLAKKVNGESILLTFHPHPRHVIQQEKKGPDLITLIPEKIKQLEKFNLDHLIIIPFTREFSSQEPESYIRDFLVRYFDPSVIVIGYNHKFGKNRKGDIKLLRKFGEKYNFRVTEIPKQEIEEISVSSTKIRNALKGGDLRKARQLLGYPFSIAGTVVKGDGRGKNMGFPTANIKVPEDYKLIPEVGVYAVYVRFEGTRKKGMLNIGYRPTFNGENKSIEVHIFDFEEEIYDEPIQVELIEKIRPEKKFEGPVDLKKQLKQDRRQALDILS